jgi:predicted dehydrogenase
MITLSIIGLGGRGRIYAANLKNNKDVKIVALCDINQDILDTQGNTLNVASNMRFSSDADFFSKGKLSDALVISTGDRDHYGHAIKALNLGYNLLLEKPISPLLSECEEIEKLAKEKGLTIVVCHVLRYSGFYDTIKRTIDDNKIGDIVSIDITENVGYWHFSHSYVRGNWRNESGSGPSILAKCCHDLDMIHYLSGQKPISVFSIGSRTKFLLENAPEDSTNYCLDPCPVRKKCPYDARKIYYGFTRHTLPLLIVKIKLITQMGKPRIKDLKKALITSPYGRCVYKCDNDVIENQMVTVKLESGITANLHMNAFSKKCYRALHITGTKGEILGDDKDGRFKLNIFGGPSKVIKSKSGNFTNHLGGDSMLVKDFVDYLAYGHKSTRLSTIDVTMESHRMAFAAEISRKSGEQVTIRD